MNCQEVMELMQRHVDGDLDQQETALMTAHVGGCPECAVMLERLQRLSDDLSLLPRVEPKFSIVDAILPQLVRLESERLSESAEDKTDTKAVVPRLRSERPRGRLLRRWSGIVAAGIVAGLLLISQQLQLSNDHSDNDAAAPGEFGNAAFSVKAPEYAATMEDGEAPAAAPEAGVSERSSSAKIAPDSVAGGAAQEAPAASEQAIDNGSAASIAEPGINSVEVGDQYGANAFVTPSIGSDEETKSKTSDVNSINGLTAQVTALVSPDGLWRAVAYEGDGTLRIYATKDDSLVFESEHRAGSLTGLAWEPESEQLTYTWIDEQGNKKNLAYNADEIREFTP
ncbi:anti-sigma factor family protein [Cohnella panacarvi]|uniref:anti-sigma factor family protein n=1 Tax=Cohnella panacarvi TaxID=400776 RepID=UPI00047C39A1|nr:zf-HC2 domain-containing protein [Cohnella panacarvi]